MSLQRIVMRNRFLTNQLMSRMPPAAHEQRGQAYALKVVEAAMTRTKAYPDFLARHGITERPVDMEGFAKLPVIDKKGYVDAYSLQDLCLDGAFAGAYTIEKSSGHSGGCYYWLRLPEEDALFPQYLEHAFVQFYGVDRSATLVLITLALGTWTSGEKMAQALREVAAQGRYPLTVMAPGTDLEEILQIVEQLSPSYDQTVIVGYPPFIKTVVDEGVRRGVDWKALNVRLGLGGEGYSEHWREHVASSIGLDSRKDLLGVSGGYGAADIGMSIGREYPLTVMIRKLCMDDPSLAATLFRDGRGNHSTLPSLLQYNPGSCYAEEVEKELVFTVLSGIPLVRYNIHDQGGTIPFDQMMTLLRDHGYDVGARLAEVGYGPEQLWTLPFFHVYGRTDGTVSIVGANIFPENLRSILAQAGDDDILSFRLAVETTTRFAQRLLIHLEHRANHLSQEEATLLAARYYELLVDGLRRVNRDFRDAHDDNPEAADPIVRVHARRTGPFAGEKGIKHRYVA